MKHLFAVLFALVLALSACGGSDTETSDTETSDTETSDHTASSDTATASEDSGNEDETGSDDEAGTESDGDESGAVEGSGTADLDAEGQALADALTGASADSIGDLFTEPEVQCANERLVSALGVEQLAGYGITAANPDDTLLPDDFEVQELAVTALSGCLDLVRVFSAQAPDCDLSGFDNEDFVLALRFDFLSSYPEFDDPAAAGASNELNAALEACSTAG